MASISTYMYDKPVTVRLCSSQEECDAWQAVKVEILDFTLNLSREEAATLAADLLNAVEAEPADAQQAEA